MLSIVKPDPLGLLDDRLVVVVLEGLKEGGERGIRGKGGKGPIKGNPGFSG